jgi:hypothetical protein
MILTAAPAATRPLRAEMRRLQRAILQLDKQRAKFKQRINQLNNALVLVTSTARTVSRLNAKVHKVRSKLLQPAKQRARLPLTARRKIADAQRKRWALWRKVNGSKRAEAAN